MELEEYARAFDEVEDDFERSVEQFGLPFEATETEPRAARPACARACGCHCENGDSSLWLNWISPACLACRTGEETETFFVDLRCLRHCYFCFNPNQEHYGYFLEHERDIAAELRHAHAHGARFSCLAITGGEPMLHKPEVMAFLDAARELYPRAYVRLYTSGDLMDEAILWEMADAGLDEVRFSVKVEDLEDPQAPIYATVEKAVEIVPTVMLELPVIPGTLDAMKRLLVWADGRGVRGVNLLEFCFPLCNAEEFSKRGFELRRHPYKYLYNYWYGGGLPIAGSEADALALLRFAAARELSVGLHYCSSDNKNTGQVYQQNKAFDEKRQAWLTADEGDRFLKCRKAFGHDVPKARTWLDKRGIPYQLDRDVPSIAFPVGVEVPGLRTGLSVNVFEGDYLREVALLPCANAS